MSDELPLFPLQEIGSLAKPVWRIQALTGKPVSGAAFKEAETLVKELAPENGSRLLELLKQKTLDQDEKQEVKEFYAPNRDLRDKGEVGRKGASYADLTIEVDKKLVHISFYRAKADGSPKPIEIDQAVRLAYNTRPANLVIMIENKYGKEAVDREALERFLHSVIDAVRDGAGRDSVKVRDLHFRDRIIRYFDAYKPR